MFEGLSTVTNRNGIIFYAFGRSRYICSFEVFNIFKNNCVVKKYSLDGKIRFYIGFIQN